jgi:hypothetical protein
MPPFNGIPQHINSFVIASTHIYTFAYSSTMESASFPDCQHVLSSDRKCKIWTYYVALEKSMNLNRVTFYSLA